VYQELSPQVNDLFINVYERWERIALYLFARKGSFPVCWMVKEKDINIGRYLFFPLLIPVSLN